VITELLQPTHLIIVAAILLLLLEQDGLQRQGSGFGGHPQLRNAVSAHNSKSLAK
jgi:hypothetical protein